MLTDSCHSSIVAELQPGWRGRKSDLQRLFMMNDERFNVLDEKIDALIALCAAMKTENQMLRANEHSWQTERQQLLDNNKLAKSRLEAVLARLKSMEQS